MMAVASVCLAVLAATAAPPAEPAPASAGTITITVSADRLVALLIRDLGAERFQTREQATATLRRIGPAAQAALEKVAADPDPEVRVRARRILEDLRLGITPDWPAEVAVLARRCDQMDNPGECEQSVNRVAQTMGERAVTFLIQRILADDGGGAQQAEYALQRNNREDVAWRVIEAIPSPRGGSPVRAVTWAFARVELQINRIRFTTAVTPSEDHAAHAAAAEKLEGLGRRVEAAAEWEAVLKTAPAGGAPDLNALVHLSGLYSDSGLFARAAKYLQTAWDLYAKSRDSVTMEGATEEALASVVQQLSEAAQQWPAKADAVLVDDTAQPEASVEILVTARQGKLDEWLKAASGLAAKISLDVRPTDLRVFDDVPITLRYDPKQRKILTLLGESPCAEPTSVDLGDSGTDVNLGVETPRSWFVFSVNTTSGQVQQTVRYEKVFVASIKLPAAMGGLHDTLWIVNGRHYTGEEVAKGIQIEILPAEFRVMVQGTTAEGRHLTWRMTLVPGVPKPVPKIPESPESCPAAASP
jgi:hypothetical protein